MDAMMTEATTAHLQLKIGGMACSFCTETIRQAYSRMAGVQEVHVSLSHEEALVRYDPRLVTPTALQDTLRNLGYTVRDCTVNLTLWTIFSSPSPICFLKSIQFSAVTSSLESGTLPPVAIATKVAAKQAASP